MSRIKTFIIGRHQDCDLSLTDSSVSRRHAEVVLTPDGNYYITDRNSTLGTFIYNGSDWEPIRQITVTSSDRLRCGHYEIIASRFEFLRTLSGSASSNKNSNNVASAYSGHSKNTDNEFDPNRGLIRNPETGEIIEKS